jgi:hypothetical protein
LEALNGRPAVGQAGNVEMAPLKTTRLELLTLPVPVRASVPLTIAV